MSNETELASVLTKLLEAADMVALHRHIGQPKTLVVNDIEITVDHYEARALDQLMETL